MNKWLLGILAALVVLGGVFLLWKVRSNNSPIAIGQKASPTKQADSGEPAVKRLPTAAQHKTPIDQVKSDDEPQWDPLAEETTPSHLISLRLGGDVPQRILAAAGQCYRGEPGRFEEMKVKYSIRYKDGEATILDAEMVETDMNQPKLEKCVVQAMTGLAWSDPKAPDLEDEMVESISMLALQKRAPYEYRPAKYKMGDESEAANVPDE